ncbi:hypothetical protein LTR27_007503 [Elasticomyces elasticus]|nr:hypothetical protein LTR27_007503 [Elasticomyces elasticus]
MPPLPPLFGLGHEVFIKYPAWPEEMEEYYTILPIDNAENRYAPLHALVDDEKVRNNTEPSEYDLDVFSRTGAVLIGHHDMVATYRKLQPRVLRSTIQKSDPERLVSDMKSWTAYNGHSWLQLATYDKEGGDGEMYILLVRTSYLQLDDGATLSSTEDTYEMTLAEFEALDLSDLWFTNALDVLYQRSDRALQHVGFHRRLQHLELKNASKLKRRVLTDYMMLGQNMVVEDTKTVADDVCPICQMNFDSTNVVPLQLKCHPTHTICEDCYPTWAGTSKAVGCPHCRARMFTDDDLRMLIWGLGPTYKTYDPSLPTNQRFPDAWETFHLPEDDMREFSFDALLLTRAWKHLIKGALLEPADSTPYLLQPVRFPEITFITSVIRDVFDELEGHTRTESHKYALQAITRRLNAEFRKSAQWATLTRGEQKVMKVNHLRYFGERRAGLETFLSRTLARTIAFSNGRYCESDSVECQHAWHKHGEKAFFNRDYSEDLEDE